MKNKKLLYVLIPGTLLVWGMIIQKIYSAASGTEGPLDQHTASIPLKENMVMEDTFSIHPVYPDPFREPTKKIVAKSSEKTVSKQAVKKTNTAVISSWPSVVYGGIIKNQNSKKELALVSVNGQSSLMSAGDKAGDVQLLKVYKDSIQVKFGKEDKYVRK